MTGNYTTVDRIALAISGGLAITGTVLLGLVETFTGRPYAPVPLTDDAGTVTATPTVDPALRTGLVIAGIVLFTLWGLYRVATRPVSDGRAAGD
ncbi:MAG: hypothetical protein J07HB67_00621 [halophilic archaeon J07HB67]|jgi:hypothetical protein|nr:MAG: hypothetical protein J07HB67_00621 [halophilic archaeon J07HB67]